MFERFFPDEYLDSAYVVNYEKLYQEGYRGILFDIDNTLVPHGAPADPEAVRLFQQLRDIGFSCCLVSNNRKKRVEPFAASVGAQFIEMAKNAGLRNILVKPINPKEEIQIVLKRYLEKIVLHFYTKEEKNS